MSAEGPRSRPLGERLRHTLRPVLERRWVPFAALCALALTIRVGWVLAIDRGGFVLNDAMMYHTAATSVARGNGFRLPFVGPTAQWPPGYPTILAGLYSIFGERPVVGELFNAVVGAATVIPVVILGERLQSRRVGLIAGFMFALMPGAIMWTDLLVTETLYTAMLVCFVLLLSYARPSWGWAAAIGVTIGIGALVRGEALTWGLLPMVLWWTLVRRGELGWRTYATRLVAAAAAAAVVMSPWTIRNAVVMDAFVPVATNASYTLWSGHHDGATGAQTYPPEEFFDQFDQEAPRLELDSSRALRSEALDYMVHHPIEELKLIPRKLVSLNRGDSYILDWVNDSPDGYPPPLGAAGRDQVGAVADAAYFGVLTLTIIGVAWLGRRWWRQPIAVLIATLFVMALVLYGFVYYGNYRYRFPLEPFMLLVSAAVIDRLVRTRPSPSVDDAVAEPTPN